RRSGTRSRLWARGGRNCLRIDVREGERTRGRFAALRPRLSLWSGRTRMVGPATALLALAIALGVYYVGADSLPISGLWTQVVLLWFLVIPAVFALVYLVLPLRQRPWLLQAGIGVAVLAVVLQIVGLDVIANFAKLGAVTLLAWWFLSFFETSAWVATVAVIIPWVDAISVWRGPTKQIVTHKRELFTA